MEWRQQSEEMRRALKNGVVPDLRSRGFKGSFPHFLRQRPDRIDVLMFQFSQFGPDLYVEIASCPPTGVTLADGTTVAPARIRAFHAGRYRRRIGPMPALDFSGIAQSGDADKLASIVANAIERDGEPWWQSPKSCVPT